MTFKLKYIFFALPITALTVQLFDGLHFLFCKQKRFFICSLLNFNKIFCIQLKPWYVNVTGKLNADPGSVFKAELVNFLY